MRFCFHNEVRPIARGFQISRRSAPPAFVIRCRLVIPAAFLRGTIEVGSLRDARLRARGQQRLRDFPVVRLVGHPQRPTGTMEFVGAAFVVLGFAEIGQHVIVRPAFIAQLSPLVVIGGIAAHVDHAVDAAGAAQHLATWLVHGAALQFLFRLAFEHPVDPWINEGLGVAHRHVDPEMVVVAAGFQQQHAVPPVFGKARGEHAAGRTGPGYDEVVGVGVGRHRSSPP